MALCAVLETQTVLPGQQTTIIAAADPLKDMDFSNHGRKSRRF
jgi:hypothetical protein